MHESRSLQTFGQVRKHVYELCAERRFGAAHLYLLQEKLSPVAYADLWEYLARRSDADGQSDVAHAVRRALWDAAARSTDTAIQEAAYYLAKGDHASAAFIVEAVFGKSPDDQDARLILARCHLLDVRSRTDTRRTRTDRDLAGRLVEGIQIDSAEDAMTVIDLLRFSDHFDLAFEYNSRARDAYPDDIRFVLREARMKEQTYQIEDAIALWESAAQHSERYHTEALFKLVTLNHRLARHADAERHSAELILLKLSSVEKMRLALLNDQNGVVEALAEYVASGDTEKASMSYEEKVQIAEMLLDNGSIGLAIWMRKQRVSIGERVTKVLDENGFGTDGDRPQPASFRAAARLRSPDFMFPLQEYLGQAKTPAGWPGTNLKPDRILLVNASLTAGGAERQFVELARALIADGLNPDAIDVALYSLAEDRGQAHFLPELRELGVRIHELNNRKIANPTLPSEVKQTTDALPLALRRDFLALWHLAAEIRPNVVHGWQDRSALTAALVGRLLRTERVILSMRNMAPPQRNEPGLQRLKALYNEAATTENFTLTCNSLAGARDYETWLGLAADTVPVLANTVNTERFSPSVRKPRADGDPIRLIGVFRLDVNKRPELWVETVAALRSLGGISIKPMIFGAGPLSAAVRQRADTLGLDDLAITEGERESGRLYGQADAMLLMSRVEGTPNVLLEAQSCGIPAAACDVGGVREALNLEGANGGLLLSPDVDPEEAAKMLYDWLPNAIAGPEAAHRRFVTSTFGPEVFARRAMALYSGTTGPTNG